MGLERYRYIVVVGPIGVGKTTLANKLGEHLGAKLLLENPDAIPFLPKFYVDMQRYALPTQLSFLFQRVDQVASLQQMDLFGGTTVSDFLFDKDPLFAELILNDDEYRLYSDIYRHLRVRAPTPDLVIYLQADIDTLIERVRTRSREFEDRRRLPAPPHRPLQPLLLRLCRGTGADRQHREPQSGRECRRLPAVAAPHRRHAQRARILQQSLATGYIVNARYAKPAGQPPCR
jgi:deoxyadenosine/deoxycytidine kinase